MKLQSITPIQLEWNEWNGFIFSIIDIELAYANEWFHRSLFGLYITHSELILDLAFIRFEIKIYDN